MGVCVFKIVWGLIFIFLVERFFLFKNCWIFLIILFLEFFVLMVRVIKVFLECLILLLKYLCGLMVIEYIGVLIDKNLLFWFKIFLCVKGNLMVCREWLFVFLIKWGEWMICIIMVCKISVKIVLFISY